MTRAAAGHPRPSVRRPPAKSCANQSTLLAPSARRTVRLPVLCCRGATAKPCQSSLPTPPTCIRMIVVSCSSTGRAGIAPVSSASLPACIWYGYHHTVRNSTPPSIFGTTLRKTGFAIPRFLRSMLLNKPSAPGFVTLVSTPISLNQ